MVNVQRFKILEAVKVTEYNRVNTEGGGCTYGSRTYLERLQVYLPRKLSRYMVLAREDTYDKTIPHHPQSIAWVERLLAKSGTQFKYYIIVRGRREVKNEPDTSKCRQDVMYRREAYTIEVEIHWLEDIIKNAMMKGMTMEDIQGELRTLFVSYDAHGRALTDVLTEIVSAELNALRWWLRE